MDKKELLKRVRLIELKTKGMSQQLFSGDYQSAFKGRGMSFSEVRSYQFGDDVRSIDWNVTARFREPYVKVFEEERELTVLLVIDLSGSMYFGKTIDSKFVSALEVVATIAFSAAQKNDKIGAIFVTDKVEKYIPPKKGIKHVYSLLNDLIYFVPNQLLTNLESGLKHVINVQKQRSVCFLVSDFIDVTALKEGLTTASRKHDLIAIQLEDKGEEQIPNVGFVQWMNAETGRTTWVDTSSRQVQEQYADNQLNKRKINNHLFNSLGIDSCTLASGESVYLPLIELFKRRK